MTSAEEADLLILHGVLKGGAFRPNSVAVPSAPEPDFALLIPLGENLLPLAKIQPFGVEERAAASYDGNSIQLRCDAGRSPAGIILTWPGHRLPRNYAGKWHVDGRTSNPVTIAAAAIGEDAPPDRIFAWNGGATDLPLFNPANVQSLVLVCPPGGTSLSLRDLRILPARRALGSFARGTWVWREQDWNGDPHGFAQRAAAAGWTELAIQQISEPGEALETLMQALAVRGITLRLLEGDPEMASAEGLRRALPRLIRLRRWFEHTGCPVPILELDVEPYGTPAFAQDMERGWQGWANAVRTIAAAWGSSVAVDVPWWMRRSPAGEGALAHAGSAIGEIIVMAYRTDPQLILDAAEPWLAANGAPVQIAIESGPVSPEVSRSYRRAAKGTLRVTPSAVELLAAPVSAGPGEKMFALASEQVTDPRRVSFHDAPHLAAAAEKSLLPHLTMWPAFNGFRIHGWQPSEQEPQSPENLSNAD